jgi:hypothetical protein
VWQPYASKQRLWVGTSRYRSGRRCACANTNCFPNTSVKRYSVRAGNAIAHSYGNSYCDCNAYSAAGDADANTYSNTDATTYSDTNASAQSNTKAPADSASSAVRKDL